MGAAGSWRTRRVGEDAGMRTRLFFWAEYGRRFWSLAGLTIGADPRRGGRLGLAGEGMVDDRKVARLLVTRNGGVPFLLVLDLETFFIVRRIDPRRQASGGGKRKW